MEKSIHASINFCYFLASIFTSKRRSCDDEAKNDDSVVAIYSEKKNRCVNILENGRGRP